MSILTAIDDLIPPLAPPTTIGKPDAKKRADRNWDNLMTDEYEDGNPAPTPHPPLAYFMGPKRVKHLGHKPPLVGATSMKEIHKDANWSLI
ncbi:hypothetical protein V6N13_073133 [Hibiscus sabdariffa]